MTALRLATFELDRLVLGVALDRVQEVVRAHPLTGVPLGPSALGGLMNLRGEVVPALDLRARLGRPPAPTASVNLVLRTPTGPVSLLVDRIGDVVTVEEAQVEPLPETVEPGLRRLLSGVCMHEASLLLLLDVDAAVDLSPEALAPHDAGRPGGHRPATASARPGARA